MTLSLDEKVLRWARVRAAESNTSVSRLVGDMLERQMRSEDGYERAMRDYFELPDLELGGSRPYVRREELYDRPGLR